LRKYLIIIVSTFVVSDTYQLHSALGILALSLHLHDAQRPYGSARAGARLLHRFETVSLVLLFFILWSGVYFSLRLCETRSGWCSFLVVVILATNIGFLLVLGSRFCVEFSKRNKLGQRASTAKHLLYRRANSVRSHVSTRLDSMRRRSRGGSRNLGNSAGREGSGIGGEAKLTDDARKRFSNTWSQGVDSNGEQYFFNAKTGRSQVERPVDFCPTGASAAEPLESTDLGIELVVNPLRRPSALRLGVHENM
jgi:hypothetical protein